MDGSRYDGSLSVAMTKILALIASIGPLEEDLALFGAPSECYGDLYRHLDKEADKIANKAGYLSYHDLVLVIEQRTSYKWVYFYGLGVFDH